jgi:hypothetical protein
VLGTSARLLHAGWAYSLQAMLPEQAIDHGLG